MSSYGDRISLLRENAGLNQSDLAFECAWKTSRLSNYETGYRTPKMGDLTTISNVLDKYLGKNSILFIVTGKSVEDFIDEDSKKATFSPEKAVSIFKTIMSDAVEMGYIRTRPGFKVSELIRTFSKSCGASLQSSTETNKEA